MNGPGSQNYNQNYKSNRYENSIRRNIYDVPGAKFRPLGEPLMAEITSSPACPVAGAGLDPLVPPLGPSRKPPESLSQPFVATWNLVRTWYCPFRATWNWDNQVQLEPNSAVLQPLHMRINAQKREVPLFFPGHVRIISIEHVHNTDSCQSSTNTECISDTKLQSWPHSLFGNCQAEHDTYVRRAQHHGWVPVFQFFDMWIVNDLREWLAW